MVTVNLELYTPDHKDHLWRWTATEETEKELADRIIEVLPLINPVNLPDIEYVLYDTETEEDLPEGGVVDELMRSVYTYETND